MAASAATAAAAAAAAAGAAVSRSRRGLSLVVVVAVLLLLLRPSAANAAAAASGAESGGMTPAAAMSAAAAAAGGSSISSSSRSNDNNNDSSSNSSSLIYDVELSPGAHNVMEALLLAGFGRYRYELQQLMRVHFTKLLQHNKPAAAAAMPLVEVKVYCYDPLPLNQGEVQENEEHQQQLLLMQQQQQQQQELQQELQQEMLLLHQTDSTGHSSSHNSFFSPIVAAYSSSSSRRERNSNNSNLQQREALLSSPSSTAAAAAAASTSAAAAAAAALAGGGFEVSVDAAATAAVRAYWGVGQKAMETFIKGNNNSDGQSLLSGSARRLARLLPSSSSDSSSSRRFNTGTFAADSAAMPWGPDGCCLMSAPQIVPAGRGHRLRFFTHDRDNTAGRLSPFTEAVFPLVIVASVGGSSATCHLLLLRCRPLPPPPPSTSSRSRVSAAEAAAAAAAAPLPACYVSHRYEVYRQLLAGGSLDKPQEKGDIFGVSSSSGTLDLECLVCMTNPKNVVLYPCRHCALCLECLQALHQEKCPVCRSHFFGFITFPLSKNLTAAESVSVAPAAAVADSRNGVVSSGSSNNGSTNVQHHRGGSRVVPAETQMETVTKYAALFRLLVVLQEAAAATYFVTVSMPLEARQEAGTVQQKQQQQHCSTQLHNVRYSAVA
ncbi:hypothetical protein, conserved [Eimeria maxima]|uniref:RING-type domain-containing protein n=1 Tax=Eimeria maxima TaxID=5804 RepID=U6ME12_EIMMA|nr:hypothetical protein, conserved [Eimeria maxima]CDJ60679.1 hypothetical protein, conserved [Eimeria maxima]